MLNNRTHNIPFDQNEITNAIFGNRRISTFLSPSELVKNHRIQRTIVSGNQRSIIIPSESVKK